MQPRPYQIRDINAIRQAVIGGARRVLYVLPTGGGKTVVASEIIRLAAARNKRIYFVAHRLELVNQCSAKLDEMGVDHGVIMASHPRNRPSMPVQVVSIQTAIRRNMPWKPDIVFIDEAHRARGASYQAILEACDDPVLIGITATPIRADNKGLGGKLFTALVQGPGIGELIAEGHLVKPEVYSWPVNMNGVKITAGDYDQKQTNDKMSQPKLLGDVLAEWKKRCSDRTTVIFASGIGHSKLLVDQFSAAGVRAAHLDGTTPKMDRENILYRLAHGDIQVVSNFGVLCEGWDCPRVSALSIVRPTKSLGLYLQMAGRALRPSPGKTDCIAEGQLVLTDCGEVPIEKVTTDMKVWDGSSWVAHRGPIFKGEREVITYAGLTATADHRVWTRSGWRTMRDCSDNGVAISQTGINRTQIRQSRNLFTRGSIQTDTREEAAVCPDSMSDLRQDGVDFLLESSGRKNWRLPRLWPTAKKPEMVDRTSGWNAAKMHQSTEQEVLGLRRTWNTISIFVCIGWVSLYTGILGLASRYAFRPREQRWALRAWKYQMVDAGSKLISHTQAGDQPSPPFLPDSISTREVCGRYVEPLDRSRYVRPGNHGEVGPSVIQAKRRVWDILDAGPFHRFTVSGLLVHNCIILDHGGCALRPGFGRPDAAREWELTEDRVKSLGDDTRDVDDRIDVCPDCGALYEKGEVETCQCGYDFARRRRREVEIQQGELVRLEAKQQAMLANQKQIYFNLLEKQATAVKIDGTPYSQKYAAAAYKGLFNEWPPRRWEKEYYANH